MSEEKVASWIQSTDEDGIEVYNCSNCYEEEGPDAPEKFSRCPNCGYRMVDL